MKPAPRSASNRVLLAGHTRSGFGEAKLDIVWFGIVCFDHGPCSFFWHVSLTLGVGKI
tara:strand:- start:1 stop:174 length:174 start_codon:yes stop_codon:yes gene_type:complete